MDISIMEDVIRTNAPDSIKSDPAKMATYISNTINSISSTISNLRPDQAFVHTDSLGSGYGEWEEGWDEYWYWACD